MKAILEFNLPEEQHEHSCALHGADWMLVVTEMDNKLRDWLKHGHEFKTPTEALNAARTELNTLADDYGLLRLHE